MPVVFSYLETVTISARRSGKRVGKALVTFDESSDAILDDIHVPKEFEGTGVGRSLLLDVVRLAVSRGKTALYTHPSAYKLGPGDQKVSDPDEQERLESFYRRNGFAEDEQGGNPSGGWVRDL